jgi:hypothetical protein
MLVRIVCNFGDQMLTAVVRVSIMTEKSEREKRTDV